MLWIQAADGTLINLGEVAEIVTENGCLYAVGVGGRRRLASTAGGNNLAAIVGAIKTALGSSYSSLAGNISPES